MLAVAGMQCALQLLQHRMQLVALKCKKAAAQAIVAEDV